MRFRQPERCFTLDLGHRGLRDQRFPEGPGQGGLSEVGVEACQLKLHLGPETAGDGRVQPIAAAQCLLVKIRRALSKVRDLQLLRFARVYMPRQLSRLVEIQISEPEAKRPALQVV